MVGRSRVPVSVIVTLPVARSEVGFGDDVEFGMDVAAIGKRHVAARDAEGAAGQINLAALAQA